MTELEIVKYGRWCYDNGLCILDLEYVVEKFNLTEEDATEVLQEAERLYGLEF